MLTTDNITIAANKTGAHASDFPDTLSYEDTVKIASLARSKRPKRANTTPGIDEMRRRIHNVFLLRMLVVVAIVAIFVVWVMLDS